MKEKKHERADVLSFNVGDRASLTRVVSEGDIIRYAEITGDMNPAHLDKEYARNTPFGERVAHGMLTAGYLGAVLAMKLPGPGTIYKTQNLSFLAPVKIGDTITAEVQIREIGVKRKTATLKTWCTNQDGRIVLEGLASVYLPRRRKG